MFGFTRKIAAPILVLAATETPPMSDVIGPYGALVLALTAIAYLVKQLADERAARNQLAERLTDQAERMVPVMQENSRVLQENTEVTRRLIYHLEQGGQGK